MTFGEKLQELRKARGWSQEELAGQIHVSRQALSKWESGGAVPDTENIIALSRLFGVTTDYLLLDEVRDTGQAAPRAAWPKPRRYLLAAASNGPYEQQLHRLALAGMKDFFDWFFISERIGASKPSKLFFDEAFRQVNEGRETPVLPEDTAIIGDSLTSDMAGGRGCGLKTVYYRRPGAAPANDSVDVTAEDLRDIPALLQ